MAPGSFFNPLNQRPPTAQADWGTPLQCESLSAHGLPNANKSSLACRNLSVFYGDSQVVFDVNLDVQKNEVLALIGPSGSGKTSILRCLNRMNDQIPTCQVTGSVWFGGNDIYAVHADAVATRMAIGMVSKNLIPIPGLSTKTLPMASAFMEGPHVLLRRVCL